MAQTVAVIRGTTTVASGGSVTLFTLSSGIATRVILGGFSCGLSTGASANNRVILNINVNGSGTYLPVAAGGGNGNSSRYFALFPNASAGLNGNSIVWSGNPFGNYATSSTMIIGTSAQTGYSTSATDMTYHFADNQQTSISANPLNIAPAQFWMANGDSLVAIHSNNNAYTGNLAYHFVTITES